MYSIKKSSPIFVLLFMIFFSYRGYSIDKQRKIKFLVLGFDSKLLNNTHSRLLRENVLRNLHYSGYSIVPVMEFERVFKGVSEERLRKPGRSEIRKYSILLNADYALTGRIYARDSVNDKIIKKSNSYLCFLYIYIRREDRFIELSFDIKGRNNYYEYFTDLSARIVSEITKVIAR